MNSLHSLCKSIKKIQSGQSSGRDFRPGLPEYKSTLLQIQLLRSVYFLGLPILSRHYTFYINCINLEMAFQNDFPLTY
jgi:hypothetical protein